MKHSSKGCSVALIICGLLLASSSLAENVNCLPSKAAYSSTPNSNFIVIDTNSTISEPFFNHTSSNIVFTVTGPSNTSGYIWCKISPNLISDSDQREKVNVYLDGNQISYIYTYRNESWELFFNYTHSNHEVVISLPQEKWTILGVDPVIWAALLITGVPLIIVIMAYHKKQRALKETKRTYKLNTT